jgi:hypothetical protein
VAKFPLQLGEEFSSSPAVKTGDIAFEFDLPNFSLQPITDSVLSFEKSQPVNRRKLEARYLRSCADCVQEV